MIRSSRLLLVLCLLAAGPAGADRAQEQLVLGSRPDLVVPRLERAPRLEEFLDMRAPAELDGAMARVNGFVQREPEDGKPASQKTDVYLGYDDTNLYVVFVAFDDEPEKIRAHLNRRENVFGDEIVEIQLDTYLDQRRAFSFVANPHGIQWDAIWTEGQGFDSSWDTVWHSRGRLTDRGYVVVMTLPFKSLRFPPTADQTWGVVLVRDIPRNNESSFWPRVSNRIEGRLNQEATLHGLSGISPGRNMQVIPYGTARSFRIREDESSPSEGDDFDPDGGLDAKLVIRDSLALDLTANPDFSQVESDQPQITVNQRFEVFFPEKRPFFLENAGYFQTPFNLLFTRRIAEPRAGARLTGKLGAFSLGALLIDDEAPGKSIAPGNPGHGDHARFGVLRLSRDVLQQSNVGLMVTDREFDDGTNRVGGIDGRFKLDDHWDTRFQAVYSETDPSEQGAARLSDQAYDLSFNRDGRKLTSHIHYREIGPDFRTEAGFVPRNDIREFHQSWTYTFRPEGRRLISWGPNLFVGHIWDHEDLRLDESATLSWQWEFRRQTNLSVSVSERQERLRAKDDFDTLKRDGDYSTDGMSLGFSTSVIRAVSFNFGVSGGDGINFEPPGNRPPAAADRASANAGLTLRLGKRLRIDNTVLYTRLDDEVSGLRIFSNRIARSRWNWQFDPKLSLRLIVQYEQTRTNPELTTIEADKRWNGDALLTYLVNPWTAVYLGYNTNLREEDNPIDPTDPDLFNDTHQVFVKISYLFRP